MHFHKDHHHGPRFWVKRIILVLIFVVIAAIVLGFVVMALWNWLMPTIFSLPGINYWQALGLLILSWILFGGLRGRHHRHGGHWRHRLREKWMHMTPEEREKFRQHLHEHWHHHGDGQPSPPSA